MGAPKRVEKDQKPAAPTASGGGGRSVGPAPDLAYQTGREQLLAPEGGRFERKSPGYKQQVIGMTFAQLDLSGTGIASTKGWVSADPEPLASAVQALQLSGLVAENQACVGKSRPR